MRENEREREIEREEREEREERDRERDGRPCNGFRSTFRPRSPRPKPVQQQAPGTVSTPRPQTVSLLQGEGMCDQHSRVGPDTVLGSILAPKLPETSHVLLQPVGVDFVQPVVSQQATTHREVDRVPGIVALPDHILQCQPRTPASQPWKTRASSCGELTHNQTNLSVTARVVSLSLPWAPGRFIGRRARSPRRDLVDHCPESGKIFM